MIFKKLDVNFYMVRYAGQTRYFDTKEDAKEYMRYIEEKMLCLD